MRQQQQTIAPLMFIVLLLCFAAAAKSQPPQEGTDEPYCYLKGMLACLEIKGPIPECCNAARESMNCFCINRRTYQYPEEIYKLFQKVYDDCSFRFICLNDKDS
ncbi:hypothetical protein M569_07659 [Genlisea aurea]|uniref:Bifunctional inhibitor/plant lipid transfer protein/seed storage helical domain-containing protein n=1 Tax=Genlisea aurea TaxID=192259 RepID=S8E490_9LAMI|nr:hypothetical protein M569_07659 [Genlisea aurea]